MKKLILASVFCTSIFAMPPIEAFNLVRSVMSEARFTEKEHMMAKDALMVLKNLAEKEQEKEDKAKRAKECK
jgi:hypothetical protein